jgi:hypothetical protein
MFSLVRAPLLEQYASFLRGKNRMVSSTTHILAGMKTRTPLPNDNLASLHELSTIPLYAEPLGLRIPTVSGTSTRLFMRHDFPRLNSVLKNAGNLDFRIVLAVAHPFHMVLAPSELDDIDFFMPAMGLYDRRDLAVCDKRIADLQTLIRLDRKHLIKVHLIAGKGVQSLDLKILTLLNPILLTAGVDDRVHL